MYFFPFYPYKPDDTKKLALYSKFSLIQFKPFEDINRDLWEGKTVLLEEDYIRLWEEYKQSYRDSQDKLGFCEAMAAHLY